MRAEVLISKLEKVRSTGPDSWIACCPAHLDKNPSMTIRDVGERVLVHCFAECSVEDILAAVGLDFDALFPEKPTHHRAKPLRRPFNASDVLEAISTEALIAAIAARDVASGRAISEADSKRALLAAERIEAARELANG